MTTLPAGFAYAFDEAPLRRLHIKAATGGMGGQFSDGYVLGLIGIAMSLATSPLGLTTYWQGLIGSASLIGILIGSLLIGPLADRIGRRGLYSWTMAVFCIVSVLQFYVNSPEQLFVLRLILGVALGADYVVGISLVSELVPRRHRGRLLSLMMVAWVAGFSSAYGIGYLLQQVGGENAWRWILFSSAVPALLVFTIRLGTPESPLWLVNKGRHELAKRIVQASLGNDIQLPPPSAQIEQASWLHLFSRKWIRNTLVGAMFYTCQVIPYFAMSTFIPRVLETLNVEDGYASGIVYNAFLLLGSILGLMIINKISRRAFLTGSFYVTSAALLILAAWTNMPAALVVALFAVFACVLAGAGVLEFAYTPELFPTELRASGVGFVVAASRLGGAGGTFILPILMENYGTHAALGGCVAALLLGGIICQIWAPETGNTPIEGHH
ncbi:MFS transporter [Pseudomonas sp. CC120222-01a]|uniref:MFS transporter n=1 Tax=Pseudomonas sp. CC120222-01a TaxID=1378075 RepID=UPI000D8DDF59|nr:MFS transporter [Pseudomonas sp. CC120222-01a]PVZ41186.1 putative MFS transporter [Pseudomonas sp. CC120222-01a]